MQITAQVLVGFILGVCFTVLALGVWLHDEKYVIFSLTGIAITLFLSWVYG